MQITKPWQIVVVDDMLECLDMLRSILMSHGYKVRSAIDGRMALELIATETPDLILLDVMLPDMNGYEVCRRLKADEKSREVPVIFISALQDADDRIKGFEAGGVDFITKPFEPAEVLARVDRHLSLCNLQNQLEEQNIQLHQEIVERKRIEEELREHKAHLEELVAAGTASLRKTNEELQREIAERARVEETLQLNARRTEALIRLNQMTGATFQEIAEFTFEEAILLTKSKIGYLGFLNEDETVMTVHVWSRDVMAECNVAGKPLDFRVEGAGLWGEVVRQRRPIVTNDFDAPSPWKRGYPEGHVKLQRYMSVPVFVGSRIVLLAGVGNKENNYDEKDVRQLTLLLESMWQLIERRRAEQALRESGRQLATLISNLPGMAYRCRNDRNRTMEFVSDGILALTGYPAVDFLGNQVVAYADLIHPADRDEVWNQVQAALERREPFVLNYRLRTETGQILWVWEQGQGVYDAQDQLLGLEGFVTDVTSRKLAEDALRRNEWFLNSIVENIPDMIFVKDAEGLRFVKYNRAGEELLGYSRDVLIGKSDHDFFPKNEADFFTSKDRDVLQSGRLIDIPEEKIQTKHRGERILHTKKIPILDEKGNPQYLLGISEDITDRKRTEEERSRLATAIEQSADAVFITDPGWIIQYVNPACERITGYERSEIIGRHMRLLKSDKHDKAFYWKIREHLSRGEVWFGRIINRKKDGALYEAEVTASPVRDESGTIINYVSIHRDITHEVRLEKKLRQAQKMEAIGTLAGGIAHDFNNILGAIIGYAELAISRASEVEAVRRYVDQVLKAGERAKDLVSQILAFSRQTEQERKPVHVVPIVKETLKLLRSSLPSTIEIRQDIAIPAEGCMVMADPTQIHQVLMNLSTNAAHAMRTGGGILSVALSEVEADTCFVFRHPDLKLGHYVRLVVSDTGHGMDATVMERIFDPYFTTKELGEGTGLGLSIVQGIIKGHSGTITVYSEPGKGTTFNVFLPIIEEMTAPQALAAKVIPTGNDERILLVDDEKALADLGKEMLDPLGYHVTVETSSLEALATFRSRPDAFDLVITDMTMPGMTGKELAINLLRIRPDIPVILCTGFSEIITEEAAKAIGIREFAAKPFNRRTIAELVRKVLERR